ncbi:hypothetical protein HY310_01325, partial [Candidatus Microgenomates bacterium]|nr:hypothetical protein [Candidatus Microgenomates bacterium]
MQKFTKPTGRHFQEIKPGERINHWFHSAFSDKLFRIFIFSWITPLVLTVPYLLYFYNRLPKEVPLFYSKIWGDTQLANKASLFIPLLGSLLLGIFNYCFGISYHEKDKVSSYLLAGSACIVSLLSAVTI